MLLSLAMIGTLRGFGAAAVMFGAGVTRGVGDTVPTLPFVGVGASGWGVGGTLARRPALSAAGWLTFMADRMLVP